MPLSVTSTPTPAASLLPCPTTTPGDGMNDALGAIYALMARKGRSDLASAKSSIGAHEIERHERFKDQLAAIERQKKADGDKSEGFFGCIGKLVEDVASDVATLHFSDAVTDTGDNLDAAWNSPNFWKDLEIGAKYVGEAVAVVAAVAATVVTLGAAAPALVAVVIVGVSLSAASMAEGEFHYLEAAGMDEKTAGWLSVSAGVAGAACTGGAGLLSSGASTTSALGNVAGKATMVCDCVAASAAVTEGGAHAKNGDFRATSIEAAADVKEIRQMMARLDHMERMLLDGALESSRSNKRALATLQGAMKAYAETPLMAAGARV